MSEELTAKGMMGPIQYCIYKGISGKYGALRLKLLPAYNGSDNRKRNEGVVFLEAAPTVGNNQYDWENQKITMGLGIVDIGKILLFLRAPKNPVFKDGKLNIYHDSGAGTSGSGDKVKSLNIQKPEDKTNFFWNLRFETKSQNKVVEVGLPVSPDEALIVGTLLETAIPRILAWS